MDERDIIQEYLEKLRECEAMIEENKKTARTLQAGLEAVEQLKQSYQHLIELNSK